MSWPASSASSRWAIIGLFRSSSIPARNACSMPRRRDTLRAHMQPLSEGISGDVDLRGRVALVTGAARGIGRGIAETLARAGADIAVLDLEAPDDACSSIQALGRRALALAGNVAERRDVERAVTQTVETLGRLDIVIKNAGFVERTTLETLDDATLQRELDVIARGTVLCTQAAYEVMKRQGGGKIVNISSISGKLGGAVSSPRRPGGADARSGPAYALAKGGVIAFTKWVAKDAGQHGIHVNAICPGPI